MDMSLYHVIGNWKMHGLAADSRKLGQALVESAGQEMPGCRVVLCPPATLLYTLHGIIGDTAIRLGAQDCAAQLSGAYTGDISAAMIVDAGCHYVLVGHSERRQYHHESNRLLSTKLEMAHRAGLTPVLCVGESLEEYEKGNTMDTIHTQLEQALNGREMSMPLIIAYEPVWAIGSGKVPTLVEIEAVHKVIKETVTMIQPNRPSPVPVLYGGSVKANNAADILAVHGVDGVLVGGASLQEENFLPIIKAAQTQAATEQNEKGN